MNARQQLTVSVIISSFNYAEYIGETVRSVLRQTRPPLEIIVIDDGSSDESEAVVSTFGNAVKWISQRNQGASAARNHGARLAKGDVLAFLDSDDLWRPEKLARQLDAFEADPEVGLVSCGLRYFNRDGETVVEYCHGKSGWCATDILLYEEPVLNTTASAIAVRRSVFEAVGGFDQDKRMFAAEDREFCYRAASISKLVFISELLVDYRVHGRNGHLDIKKMERALAAAYEKIFQNGGDDLKHLKRRCYGNLYANLAGSHFGAGNYRAFLANITKSVFLTPSNLGRLAGYPSRLARRTIRRLRSK